MSATLADLPDDVAQEIGPHLAEDATTLAVIGAALAQKREEAKKARTKLEATWKDAEDAYVGIDDANRHEFDEHGRWNKPMSPDGPVTTGRHPRTPDRRSTVFIRMTARYVDAASAKVSEILFPADGKAFSFSEMPVPEVIKAKDDTSQVVHDGTGMPLTRPAQPGEPIPAMATPGPGMVPAMAPAGGGIPAGAMPAAGSPALPPTAVAGGAPAVPAGTATGAAGAAPPGLPPGHVPLTVADFARETIELARKKAKAAEDRIYGWMVASQYTAENRKVVFDAARIGVGILKGPYPKPSRSMAVLSGRKTGPNGEDIGGEGGITVEIREDIDPAWSWLDPWNAFPDPACGENIHDGNYFFERDHMTERQIRDLKKLPGYISDQIDAVLEEGPDKVNSTEEFGASGHADEQRKQGRFTIWYFYGTMNRDDVECIFLAAGRSKPDVAKDQIYVIATLINDRVVKATINPLDSGSFPYHSVPWQRRTGHWAGIGVAEQLRAPQKIVNAATRAMLNNAGKSAGSQIIVDRAGIRPADGEWMLTPDKIWWKTGDAMAEDVRQVFMAVEIPNMTDPLMKIIEYGMQLAEESTSIPLVTQGQSGESSPETFGATQLQNTNANQLLRDIGYKFDDYITEPVVRQTYEWLLLDPGVPDDEKGEFKINAHGSIAMVERAIQDQTIAQLGQAVVNPVYGGDPKKWFKEMLRSKYLDPANFTYTEEEQARIDAQPPPEAPAVQAAKINADAQIKLGIMKQQVDQQSAQSEERIAQAANVLEGGHIQNEQQRIQAEQHRTLTQETVKLHQIQAEREIEMLKHANQRGITLDQVKAELAKTAMQLQTERQLNAQNLAAEDRKHRREMLMKPPVQAPGRAAAGHQFDQRGRPGNGARPTQ